MKKYEIGAAITCLAIALLDYLPHQTWSFFQLNWRNARVFPTIALALVGVIILISLYEQRVRAE